MGVEELQECLQLLISDGDLKTALPAEVTSDEFAENVLGFEEVEDVEDDGEEYTQQNMEGSYLNGMGRGVQNEVIPEEDDI